MFKNMVNRISSDRADSNTLSQLLWLVIVVVVVLAVGAIITTAVSSKGNDVAKKLNDSNATFEKNIAKPGR